MAQKTINKKTNRGHSRPKTVIVVLVCVVVVALATVGALVFINRDKIFGNSEEETTTETENTESSDNSNTEDEEEEQEEKAPKYDGENPNKSETLTGVISFAGISEGKLTVNVMIDQLIGSSGKCEFTLTHSSGTTLTGSSATEAGPAASFCSYSIPSSQVKSGKYSINVKVTSTNKEGVITGEANV